MAISLNEIPQRETLEHDLTALMEGGKVVSVIFVDLDGFKQVNDQHGHAEGDRCLLEVTSAMSQIISGKGQLYRIGGDEFCIMLPNRSAVDAIADAEQVRLSIDRLKPFGGTSKVTASIGVATSCPQLSDAKSLIEAADQVMYVSKRIGKNRVTNWPPSDSERILDEIAKLDSRVSSLQAQIAAQHKRDADERQRKQRIVEELGKLFRQGQEIRDKVEFNNYSVQEVSNWRQGVEQYLKAHLGDSFANRFRSPSHQIIQFPPNMVQPMRAPWTILTGSMMMLNDFMQEHRI